MKPLVNPETNQGRLLAVIARLGPCEFLTGRQLATRAGLTYKQTITALDRLHGRELIGRISGKSRARWCRRHDKPVEFPLQKWLTANQPEKCS